MKVSIHVNKAELRKGADGFPWTIHTSKACTPAREVVIDPKAGNVTAQCFPDRKSNPKCFLVVQDAAIEPLGGGRFKVTSQKK